MSGWGPLLLVIGVLVIVVTIGRLLRRRSGASTSRLRGDERPASPEGDGRRSNVLSGETALREIERSAERRIHTLRTLINEADERIRRLNAANIAALRAEVMALHGEGVREDEIANRLRLPVEEVVRVIKTGNAGGEV